MMNALQFAELVDRVEAEARQHPIRYQWTVLGLAALGFIVLGGALVVSVLTAIVLAVIVFKAPLLIKLLIKVIWLPFVIIGATFKAAFVRVPAPTGLVLKRDAAPLLHEAVQRLCRELDAKPPHVILLTNDFNAFAAELPRLGVFFPRRYLGLGLPLLLSLSPAEVESVIAHELGHFSAKHARFQHRIYRLRHMWSAVLERTDLGVLNAFIRWYAPYFNAYTFVMARADEFVADRTAAMLTSPELVASALSRTAAMAPSLDQQFWSRLQERVEVEPEAPKAVFSELRAVLPKLDLTPALDKALGEKTGYDDTHPCLQERLAAVSAPPVLAPVSESAAERWLGSQLESMIQRFNDEWRQKIQAGWSAAHTEAQASLARLEELKPGRDLKVEEVFERLQLMHRKNQDQEAWVLALSAFVQQHAYAPAEFQLGVSLLGKNDDAAEQALTRAVNLEPALAPIRAQVLTEHFVRSGQRERALPYVDETARLQDLIETDQRQRAGVPTAKQLLSDPPLEADLVAIRERLMKTSGLQGVWVVRVQTAYAEGGPHYLLVLHYSAWGRWRPGDGILQAFAKGLELQASWILPSSRQISRSLLGAVKAQAQYLTKT